MVVALIVGREKREGLTQVGIAKARRGGGIGRDGEGNGEGGGGIGKKSASSVFYRLASCISSWLGQSSCVENGRRCRSSSRVYNNNTVQYG